MQRDYTRDDQRRRHRADDDPRDDPRERYGNEEDQYSREARRAYAEGNLPRRMRDDRPYDRPGYEPEAGRPGGRENVDLQRSRYQNDRPSYGSDWGQRDPDAAGPGQYQGRSAHPDQYSGQSQQRGRDQSDSGRRAGRERDPYGQAVYQQLASPYEDDNAIGPWYGGDTGMGDPGSSQRAGQNTGQSERWSDSRRGSDDSSRQRSGYGQSSYGQTGYGQDDRDITRQSASYGSGQSGGFSSGFQSQSFGGQRDWQRHEQPDAPHGPFSGRGPRNYQRSDERVREDVCELLTRHGGIDASQMDVDVREGVVTLRGTADSGRIRRMTEELVEDVTGVRDVQNELRVNQRTGYTDTTNGGTQATAGQRSQGYGQGQGTGTGAGHGSGDMSAVGGYASGSQARPASGASDDEHRSVPAYGTGVASTSGVSTRSGPGEPGISAGAGRSQHGNPWQIRETMDVVGSDGERIGTVKTVAGTDFILNRPMARDLHVPFSAVRTVDGERVMLACRAGEVDQQNWPTSDLTGSSSSSGAGTGTGERPSSR